MQDISIHTLHGFLGHPEDWPPFPNATHHSLYEKQLPYWEWAQDFNAKVEEDPSKVLIGYSLGGRMAMHALLDNPTKWTAGVIVSAHPGLNCEKQKGDRIQNDLCWAQKFQEEPWDKLVKSWNAQPVFTRSKSIQREEKRYSRTALSNILREWSLGQQEDLRSKLKKLPIPILWVVGSDDHKFAQLEYPENHPLTKKVMLNNASHRVPWDQPKRLYQEIDRFISSLKNETVAV